MFKDGKKAKRAVVGLTDEDARAGMKRFNVPLELKDLAVVKRKFKRF
jgi:hypothetical protein